VVDMGLLTQTAEPAKEILGIETIDVVADKGYSRSRTSRPARKPGSCPIRPFGQLVKPRFRRRAGKLTAADSPYRQASSGVAVCK
jgi:hypothetical protein